MHACNYHTVYLSNVLDNPILESFEHLSLFVKHTIINNKHKLQVQKKWRKFNFDSDIESVTKLTKKMKNIAHAKDMCQTSCLS